MKQRSKKISTSSKVNIGGDNLPALQTGGDVEKLHKQPRSLLKTVGQSISNTTEAPEIGRAHV